MFKDLFIPDRFNVEVTIPRFENKIYSINTWLAYHLRLSYTKIDYLQLMMNIKDINNRKI